MSRIYRHDAKRLPKELRSLFDEIAKTQKGERGRTMATEIKLASACNPVTKAYDPEDEMIVEGIANKAELDRVREVILPSAWKLDNFKKSPVILYEHWRENLVGRALDVKVEKDGLYYRAQIGNPKAYPLTDTQIKVRSLLAQGILKTNSVGFRPWAWEWDDDEEVLRYTDAELLEISIVAIPCQQDSLITSVKSWRTSKMESQEQQHKAEEGDKEPTMQEVKAVMDECHKYSKGCYDMMKEGSDKALKAAQEAQAKAEAELATVKAANEKLVAENKELSEKATKLVAELKKRNLIK